MTFYETFEGVQVGRTEEIVFAGAGVRLAGQIDYPDTVPYGSTYPLVFILHHAGCDDREGYRHFAESALASRWAVFRWDKRGTGRSGAGGLGSTTQDSVLAYEVAINQPHIDRRRVVILAQDAGTGLLGSSFGLFARVHPLYGVVLATNVLDETAISAIQCRLLILMGQHDWNPWQKYGKAVSEVHNQTLDYGAAYYVAPHADRMLIDPRTGRFHYGANNALQDWLRNI
jgi:hypothetical protein